jgi:hypothetical protein
MYMGGEIGCKGEAGLPNADFLSIVRYRENDSKREPHVKLTT